MDWGLEERLREVWDAAMDLVCQLAAAERERDMAQLQRDAARAIVAGDIATLSKCRETGGFAAIMGVEYDEYNRVKMELRTVKDRLTAAEAERDEWEQSWQAVRQREHVLLDDVDQLRDANRALVEALEKLRD
jgi:hypothetical protein